MAENAAEPPARRRWPRLPGRPRRPRRPLLLLAAAVLLLAGAGVAIALGGGDEPGGEPESSAQSSSAGGDGGAEPVAVEPVAGLGEAEQVDQVLLTGIEGSSLDDELAEAVGEHGLGGILIDSGNWPGEGEGRRLIDDLREAAEDNDVPPLIATAQEGGPYRELEDLAPDRTALEVGDEGSPEEVTKWAAESAAALRDAGFNLNLFPVADVATLDSFLADRAFSDSAALVTELTAAAIRGCKQEDLACAPAHFPGLGAATADTDRVPAGVSLDAPTLSRRDLPPFEAAFEEGAPAVVVSLASYAAYGDTTPAALSPEIVTGLLRDRLGYRGVAITDDLSAGAIRGSYEPGEAAVMALRAGADLVQVSNPDEVDDVREAIAAALEDGELSPGRLAQAVERVLRLKRRAGLIDAGEERSGGDRAGGGSTSEP